MKTNNVKELILYQMNKTSKNTIYTVNDFYDFGTKSAVKTALFRLTNEGLIHRIYDGYYVIPYYSELIHEYSYPTAEELATKIAQKFVWNITPYGDNALNQTGLSSQVPKICEYLSDGPYREYEYRNRVIKFKHTSNRNISKYSLPLSLIIQSVKEVGKENITDDEINKLVLFSKKYVYEDLIKDTKSLPEWIYRVLVEIDKGVKNDR